MASRARFRVAVTEGLWSADVIPALRDSGMDTTRALGVLTLTASRLRKQFALEDEAPITVDGDKVKIHNLCGVLRVSEQVEIDIAPKFLGHTHPGWREDFLAIASLTGEGRLLPEQTVRASYGQSSDLASLIGRVFVDGYWESYRRPLRVYRRHQWRDQSLDGEIDFDDFFVPSAEGIPQTAVVLDRQNLYNAILARAADALVAEVQDPAVRNQVQQVRAAIGPQQLPSQHVPEVPARHQHWRPLLELAQQVLEGFDLTLQEGTLSGPGFLIRTWQAWEQLLYRALRMEIGAEGVSAQAEHELGLRDGEPFFVRPDVTLGSSPPAMRPVDAKYKGRIDQNRMAIALTDVYEAMAFLEATGAKVIPLVYPRTVRESDTPWPAGACRVFEQRALRNGRTILGVEVEVRGIGERGGYRRFARTLTGDLTELIQGDPLSQEADAAASESASVI